MGKTPSGPGEAANLAVIKRTGELSPDRRKFSLLYNSATLLLPTRENLTHVVFDPIAG
jgi:hypothetical protein